MALQTINVGYYVNDGTGDDLRTAFVKINENFDELDLQRGQNNDGRNVGTGAGVFKAKDGVNLLFKSLIADGNGGISIVSHANDITITNNWPAITSIVADDTRSITSTGTKIVNIKGGTGIQTSITGDTLTITGTGSLQSETNPKLGANLDLNGQNIAGFGSVSATLHGTFDGISSGIHNGLVLGVDVSDLNGKINGFDFGPIIFTVPGSLFDLLMMQQDFDMGSFLTPSTMELDIGNIDIVAPNIPNYSTVVDGGSAGSVNNADIFDGGSA